MESHPRPSERISTPVVTFDLTSELEALRATDSYRHNDHASTTLVNRPGFGVVLVALPQGGHLKDHRAGRGISIQVLSGAVQLDLDQGTVRVRPGEVTALAPNLRHSVGALEDSAFLLTMGGEA